MNIDTLPRHPHLPSQIAAKLAEQIKNGVLLPGQRLPTEHTLAARFGVSRNVIREAIAQLRSGGVIQSRQGVGAFVMRAEPRRPLDIDAVTMMNAEAFKHVFEARALVEIRAAGLAARRGTKAQLAAIEEACTRMERPEEWQDAGVDADLHFHRQIGRASGNPFFADVVTFFSERMRESIVATRAMPGSDVGWIIMQTLTEHAAILAAIQAREPEAARAAMAQHLTNAAARVGLQLDVDGNS